MPQIDRLAAKLEHLTRDVWLAGQQISNGRTALDFRLQVLSAAILWSTGQDMPFLVHSAWLTKSGAGLAKPSVSQAVDMTAINTKALDCSVKIYNS